MFRHGILLFLYLAATCAYASAAEPQPEGRTKKANALDIVSDEALAAIAIRNVADLTERGHTFIEKTKIKTPFRLSDGYKIIIGLLGLHRGVDEDGAAALMMFSQDAGEDAFVLAVPFSDLRDIAANFKLTPDRLAEGKIVDRQDREGKEVFSYARYLCVRGNHLLMGGKRVEQAAKSKTLRDVLPEEDRASLTGDDILLYVNVKQLKNGRDEFLRELDRELASLAPVEAETLRQLVAAGQELRYGVGGLRLDDGLGASVLLQFEGEKSREILTRLQGGSKAKTSLSGLPRGRVLAAHASSGEGEKSAAVARSLLHFSLTRFLLDTDQFVSAGHRPNVVGLFGEVWQKLQGSRTALYENENSERDGRFSLVAVLDTNGAERFVADMTGLARFVNASTLSPDDEGERIDAKTLADLVAQLGHDEYQVRQTASMKLGLVGPPALPALEKALQSSDAEVKFRAQALRQQIAALVAEERQDLIKRNLLSRIKPNFAWFPQRETRSGRPVGIVQIRLNIDEATHAAELRRLFGPQWNKLRLATVDNRVVFLLGSNTVLLDQAIANLKTGEEGLQGEARLATFRSRAHAAQTVEFHLSLDRTRQLISPEPDAKPGAEEPGLTSLGLSIAPQRVRLDLFSPFAEVKGVVKSWRW